MSRRSRSGRLSRRRLLQLAGAGTVGLATLSGAASAHAPEEIRFYECSQVCVDPVRNYRVFYAAGDRWGYTCYLEPGTDERAETEPKCFETGEDEMILGILGGERNMFPNPNSCTGGIFDGFSLDDCTGCEDDDCSDVVGYERVGPGEYEAVGLPTTVVARELTSLTERAGLPDLPTSRPRVR